MVTPTCPKCPETTFELVELKVKKSNYKKYAVCCASCGCVVGVEDYFNTAVLLENLAKKLGVKLA